MDEVTKLNRFSCATIYQTMRRFVALIAIKNLEPNLYNSSGIFLIHRNDTNFWKKIIKGERKKFSLTEKTAKLCVLKMKNIISNAPKKKNCCSETASLLFQTF